MPRVCKTCGRLVAEAAYCPFCSEPTIEYIPVPVQHIPVPVQRSDGSEVRTILTEFQRRNNRWMDFVVIISGLTGIVVWPLQAFPPIIGLAYFVLSGAMIFLTILYVGLSACPCPQCEKNLAHLKSQNIRYCPFCRVDLAVEIYPKSQELTEFLKTISGQGGLEVKNTDIQFPSGKQRENLNIQPPPGIEVKGTAK